MTGQTKGPFNTGDCSIEVTSWAGLTVHTYTQYTYTYIHMRMHAHTYMNACTYARVNKYIHIQTEAARLGVTLISHSYIGGNKSPHY